MTRVPSSPALQLLRTDDFTGGLNLRANPFQLGGNESPDMLNVDIDPRGGFVKRPGSSRYEVDPMSGVSPTQLMRLLPFNHSANRSLVLMTQTQMLYIDEGADAWVEAFSAGMVPPVYGFGCSAFEAADGLGPLLYVSSLYESGWVWDGSAETSLTASGPGEWQDDFSTPTGTHLPQAEHLATHVDRLWAASVQEDGTLYTSRLRFSHPLFPQSWRENDYIDIPDGGQSITGIVSFAGNLVVFKQNAVYILTGYSTDTFQLVPLSLKHGCVNPLSFTEQNGLLYFLDSSLGLFAFDGSRIVNVMEPLWEGLNTYNTDSTSRVWSAKGRVYVSLDDVETYVYDPRVGRGGAWTRYSVKGAVGTEALWHGCEWDDKAFFLLDESKAVMYLETDSSYSTDWVGDDERGVDAYYVTRWHDAGNVSVKKRWRRVDMICHQPATDYDLDMKVYYDWQEGVVRRSTTTTVQASAAANPMLWGSSNWGSSTWGFAVSGNRYVRSAALGPARAVQVRIAGPSSLPWGVDSLTYKFNFRRLKA